MFVAVFKTKIKYSDDDSDDDDDDDDDDAADDCLCSCYCQLVRCALFSCTLYIRFLIINNNNIIIIMCCGECCRLSRTNEAMLFLLSWSKFELFLSFDAVFY